MKSLGRALAALAALGLLMGIAAAAIILSSEHMDNRGVWVGFNASLGGSFVGTGLYAWWRRPDNRSGALMTWVGFLWFLSCLGFSNNRFVFAVGQFTEVLPIAALVHLVLAVPSGRLESRYHRALVTVAYLNSTVFQLPSLLFTDTTRGCGTCPSNPLLISDNGDVAETGIDVVRWIAIVSIALLARELIVRIRNARQSERDVYGPLVGAALISLVAFALLFATQIYRGSSLLTLIYLAYGAFVFVPYGFLVGLLRGRLSRAAAVAELVETLGRDENRTPLRDALAESLGDSSLTLAYWIPETQTYVDADGRRVEPGPGQVATPIERHGEPLALVIHDAALAEEQELVRAAGGAAALTLENERLSAELRAKVEEVRASRARIVQAGDEERRRLERDLHDGAQQRLVTLALNLKLAQQSGDPTAQIEAAIQELTEATTELRELARGIHPGVLTDRGLGPAVDALAGRSQVPVEVLAVPEERLSPALESTVYFVVAEALTNVARYAQATHAEVEIERKNGSLTVEVRDDGVGGADPAKGSGLRGLADRVAAVDGRLVVTDDGGTTIRAEIPCAP
jgi:signal transduction histidine kinase